MNKERMENSRCLSSVHFSIIACLFTCCVILTAYSLQLRSLLLGFENKNNYERNSHSTPKSTNVGSLTYPSLCPIETIQEGKWIPAIYEKPPYLPMRGERQQRECINFQANAKFSTYEWEPLAVQTTGCTFQQFNQESFCNILKNKTLVVMGDSISLDNYISLTHLLGVPKPLPKVHPQEIEMQSLVCENTLKLVGKRDFHLKNIASVLNHHDPNIVLLNRGAHYVSNEELLKDLLQDTFPKIKEWLEKCKQRNKECTFIWRTSTPGHPNCKNYTEPATSIFEMEALVQTAKNIHQIDYQKGHWWDFKEQNEIIIKALKVSNISYDIMPAYHVNILRPDLHQLYAPRQQGKKRDCLHTCLPQDNTLSTLLHHMLLVKYGS